MTKFIIKANKTNFDEWESARITRSLDSASGTFSFTCSSKAPSSFPVRAGMPCSIYVAGVPLITGYVDEVAASGDIQNHTVTVSGRDSTCDLIDSSVPDSCKNIEQLTTFTSLCKTVVKSLGATIQITNSTGLGLDISKIEEIDGNDGDSCIEFLQTYARKLQVYLVPDGKGGMLIYRPGNNVSPSPLLHVSEGTSNNVKHWDVKVSYQNRFNKIICRSQDNYSMDADADYSQSGTSRTGTIIDSTIRASRIYEIKAEETMDDDECAMRAKEEANIRRIKSLSYTALVAGVTCADGTPWSLGDVVKVKDDFAGLNGCYLIRKLDYSVDSNTGEQTSITIAPIDAYTVQGVATQKTLRKCSVPKLIYDSSAAILKTGER